MKIVDVFLVLPTINVSEMLKEDVKFGIGEPG
jgi:hypothetical protein